MKANPAAAAASDLANFRFMKGMAMILLSSFLYASGIVIQRKALMQPLLNRANRRRTDHTGATLVRRLEAYSNLVWLGGLFVYMIANVFYTMALNYAPQSICAALFSTVLIWNAVIATYVLGEKTTRFDVAGYALIMLGITVTSAHLPHTEITYDGADLWQLTQQPLALTYLAATSGAVVLLTLGISVFEKRYPDIDLDLPPPAILLSATLAYPTLLAIYESIVQLCLKGGSNMLYLMIFCIPSPLIPTLPAACKGKQGAELLKVPMFYAVMGLGTFVSLMILVWLRKGYKRFDATQMLPVQNGVLVSSSVFGGLMFYQDYHRVLCPLVNDPYPCSQEQQAGLWYAGGGIAVTMSGIGFMFGARWMGWGRAATRGRVADARSSLSPFSIPYSSIYETAQPTSRL